MALEPSVLPQLNAGNRLVVLITIDSLQWMEQVKILDRGWQVRVDKALTKDAVFEGARAIARISGCAIKMATLMSHLPGVLPVLLYKHQASAFSTRTYQSPDASSFEPFSPARRT